MSATIEEHRLGEIPWLVVTGERRNAFRLLGEHESSRIHAVASESNAIHRMKARASSPQTADLLATVRDQSRLTYPYQWSEMVAMAEGAAIPLDNLVLLNLRGDLGVEEKIGCTDLAFRHGDGVVLAHNEDGALEFEPHCVVLTLRIDGEPTVTTWWYPGFLPANAITLNEHGLIWGIDNVNVADPIAAPGRHFVARALQSCQTITEVADRLRDEPSAGGFAYTIGQIAHRDAIQVEAAAGFYAHRSIRNANNAVLWHTNHLRILPSNLDVPSDSSRTRARTAGTWIVPRAQPVDWCLQQLAHAPMPHGVRCDAEGDSPSVTFVTFVADLSAGTVTVKPRARAAVTIPADDLVQARSDRQTAYPERRAELAE